MSLLQDYDPTLGLKFNRFYTEEGIHPYSTLKWIKRDVKVSSADGEAVFEQEGVEFPENWTTNAIQIVTSKYFHGKFGTPERETSLKQLLSRVADTIADWGYEGGYFASEQDKDVFHYELLDILLKQRASFNSPVWFNVGTVNKPQASACQPYHSLINTTYGLVPIGEIVEKNLIGLPIYDAKGITQVVNTKHNGKKQVYKILLNDGHFVEVTGDHLVCAHSERRTKRLEWKRVDELQISDYMRVYTKRAQTITPKTQNRREISEAALAGWLQADGFVGQFETGTNQSLTIEFMVVNQDEEEWVLNHLKEVFPGVNYNRTEVESKTDEGTIVASRIRLYGEVLREFVENYELLNRKTEIRVPQIIYQANNDVVKAYLMSIFESDGYVTNGSTSSHVALATISKEWMEDVILLLSRFGIYARLRKKNENRPDRFDLWEVDISIYSERKQFEKTLGFISEKKTSRMENSMTILGKSCPPIRYQQIVDIIPMGEMDVYDIQTKSGNYLTNTVLVHNCFINSVEDTMDSILDLAKTEGLIFKFGSGSGVNISKLRAKGELLSTGGSSSGPLSFMKGFDAFAGSIKSGGKTRRAAKMVLMDDWHPDVMDFIDSKVKEEKKAWALIDAGYDGSFTGEAYNSVFFQNANHSVRVSDDFMNTLLDDGNWNLRAVTTDEVWKTIKAKDLLNRVSEATHLCGDPGLQYSTTINKWHTCKNTGPINASNPCSEYVFLDDTACNLASINLMKYRNEDGSFDVDGYVHTINIIITAQEILVGNASYPTRKIEENSHVYRTLGIGYTNLGALLMSLSLPYDSDKGRNVASAITSILTGQAYAQSARMAAKVGAFAGYAENREPMLQVMEMHRSASKKINSEGVDSSLHEKATTVWDDVVQLGLVHGYRNAQTSVIAPTGTISFMMDADTTGIEPDIALIKYKKLVGGGYMKIVNTTVPLALEKLGYNQREVDAIAEYINEHGFVEGCPELKTQHLPVFDTSIKANNGTRSIHYMAHVKMMSAAQPFISGAISKTVNMPEDVTVEDINEVYIKAWKMGIKAIAIYRDNSKRLQPLNTKDDSKEEKKVVETLSFDNLEQRSPIRRRLPETRLSKTHKFEVNNHEGYIIVGLYEDNTPGEVFIKMSKQGSTLGGVMDTVAVLTSLSLQYGVPLSALVRKFIHSKFEPSGMTKNPKIPIASSIIDYIFRYLALEFLPEDERPEVLDYTQLDDDDMVPAKAIGAVKSMDKDEKPSLYDDNQICTVCGAIAVRSGSCYACPECGTTSGCS